MRANKGTNTGPELALRKTLRSRELTGYRLHRKGLPGRPDITFWRARVADFVHGCYWHRCSRCKLPLPKTQTMFWKAKLDRNRARDKRDCRQLEKDGWRVLTLWECEVEERAAMCARRVAALVGQRR